MGSTRFNHDGSINSDDGRLNFDQGDITSAPFGATLEFETKSKAMCRHFCALQCIGMLLDGRWILRAWRIGQIKVKTMPVVNLTFSMHLLPLMAMPLACHIWSALDARLSTGVKTPLFPVATLPSTQLMLRRCAVPGAEIKDALLPVEAIYGSLAVTDDLTLEAYYGGWDDYKLDAGGTPVWR